MQTRYKLSYTTPRGAEMNLRGLLREGAERIERIQRDLGAIDFRLLEDTEYWSWWDQQQGRLF